MKLLVHLCVWAALSLGTRPALAARASAKAGPDPEDTGEGRLLAEVDGISARLARTIHNHLHVD